MDAWAFATYLFLLMLQFHFVCMVLLSPFLLLRLYRDFLTGEDHPLECEDQ